MAASFRRTTTKKIDDIASSDSEGTKELHQAFDENPQAFIKVDSKYYAQLPAID